MSKVVIDRAVVEQAMKAMLNFPDDISDEMFESISALKAALAQQGCFSLYPDAEEGQAGPAQEPVAYIHRQGNHWEVSERHLDSDEKSRGWTEEPLYTAPPQRRPLTEEEIGRFCDEVYWSPRQLVRAVERAHRIKE